MKLSSEGLRLIKSFEGYHARQPDGSCKAYRCPAGVWTCGFGCTEGVTPNTHWTEAEATERLAGEIAKFETAVDHCVLVPLNQNQFDALVSFSYNCGAQALARSTLLKHVNAGRFERAAKEFPKWNRGGGRVLPGLVARRAREEALFMKPVEAPEGPIMPQKVEPEPATVSKPVVAVGTSVGTAVAVDAVTRSPPPVIPDIPVSVPAVPAPLQETVTNAQSWQFIGDTAWSFKTWAVAQPLLAGALVIGLAVYWAWPRIRAG